MSRGAERLEERFEREDRARLAGAFEALAGMAEGRWFLRWLLEVCGHGAVPRGDALTLARALGMMDVAAVVVDEMNHIVPSLYPTLIEDEINERNARNTDRLQHARS